MCVVNVHVCVYVLVSKRTFDWLDGLNLSSFDGFTFSRACTFYYTGAPTLERRLLGFLGGVSQESDKVI